MRVLFVFPDAPLSENFSGGAARFYSSYNALIKLGYEVFVWRTLASPQTIYEYEKENLLETAKIRQEVKSWRDVEYEKKIVELPFSSAILKRLYKIIYIFINPYDYFFPGAALLRDAFKTEIENVNPDFVWVEMPFLGAVVHADINVPWIYQNHDFFYKLKPIRMLTQGKRQTFWFKLENYLLRRIEYKIPRKSNFVVTGSITEADDMRKHGQPNIVVIPTTYRSIPLKILKSEDTKQSVVRIIHLGALSTTANYSGLKLYLEQVHSKLVNYLADHNIQMELHIIGDVTDAKSDLIELILKNEGKTLGFKSDLREILRPFDIAIIPYAENTGTRTKVPFLMNFAQVIVATENSIAGTPEIMECEGCIFTKDINGFFEPLYQLCSNTALREKMGLASKTFFENNFTHEAQLGRYKLTLDAITDLIGN